MSTIVAGTGQIVPGRESRKFIFKRCSAAGQHLVMPIRRVIISRIVPNLGKDIGIENLIQIQSPGESRIGVKALFLDRRIWVVKKFTQIVIAIVRHVEDSFFHGYRTHLIEPEFIVPVIGVLTGVIELMCDGDFRGSKLIAIGIVIRWKTDEIFMDAHP